MLNDLVPEACIQRDLFSNDDYVKYGKNTKIMAMLDAVNQRYGRQTLKLASEGFKAPWKMQQNYKSPSYTTNWHELLPVN